MKCSTQPTNRTNGK